MTWRNGLIMNSKDILRALSRPLIDNIQLCTWRSTILFADGVRFQARHGSPAAVWRQYGLKRAIRERGGFQFPEFDHAEEFSSGLVTASLSSSRAVKRLTSATSSGG